MDEDEGLDDTVRRWKRSPFLEVKAEREELLWERFAYAEDSPEHQDIEDRIKAADRVMWEYAEEWVRRISANALDAGDCTDLAVKS